MIYGAAQMIGTRGVGAMSLRDLAKEAGVPIGSTYHHFPGGRQQLIEEAIRTDRRGRQPTDRGQPASGDPSPRSTPSATSGAPCWRRATSSRGCPVFAVATADDEALRASRPRCCESWQTTLAEVLADAGVDRQRTPRLAMFVVAAIEGAIALCQAERSIGPLRDTMAEIHHLVDAAV